MRVPDHYRFLLFLLPFLSWLGGAIVAQEVSITNYTVKLDGRVELTVNSNAESYYLLQVRHTPTGAFEYTNSLTLGQEGTTQVTESLGAYPREHYRIIEGSVANPGDVDGDGVDDLTEFNELTDRSPLNAALPIDIADGTVAIDNFGTFQLLSLFRDQVAWSEYLNGKAYVKFIIADFHTDQPKIYFMDSNRHDQHADFAAAVNIEGIGERIRKGQVVLHPTSISSNGTLGTFAFA